LISVVTPEGLLQKGTALVNGMFQVAVISGPALGGFAYALSPGVPYSIIAISWLLAGILSGAIQLDQPVRGKEPPTLEALFAGASGDLSAIPSSTLERAALTHGVSFVDLLVTTGLADSKNAARRLIQQGGAYLNNRAVTDPNLIVTEDSLENDGFLLRQGKKKYHRVVVR
jgi:hypothetical protein